MAWSPAPWAPCLGPRALGPGPQASLQVSSRLGTLGPGHCDPGPEHLDPGPSGPSGPAPRSPTQCQGAMPWAPGQIPQAPGSHGPPRLEAWAPGRFTCYQVAVLILSRSQRCLGLETRRVIVFMLLFSYV